MKLTRNQASVVGLYTGICAGPFEDMQELASLLLKRPVFTHEFADKETVDKLKELVKPQFLAICAGKD